MQTGSTSDDKGRPSAENANPPGERRSSNRVRDDQGGGEGSRSAWSKLKMLERQRRSLEPGPDSD